MKSRVIITSIWLVAFVVALITVESYIHSVNEDGIRYLFPEDRVECMRPLLILFGGYIGGILGFWFVRPFEKPSSDHAERIRFWLAIFCTVLFVLVLNYFVSYTYLFGTEDSSVLENVLTGTKTAGMMSFLVAPINFYYFGMKPA